MPTDWIDQIKSLGPLAVLFATAIYILWRRVEQYSAENQKRETELNVKLDERDEYIRSALSGMMEKVLTALAQNTAVLASNNATNNAVANALNSSATAMTTFVQSQERRERRYDHAGDTAGEPNHQG